MRTISITYPDGTTLEYQSKAKAVKRFAVVSNLTRWNTNGEYQNERMVGEWGLCSEHGSKAQADRSFRTFSQDYGYPLEHLAIVPVTDPAATTIV